VLIEASKMAKGTSAIQKIKLTTNGFYNTSVPVVSGPSVIVKQHQCFTFNEISGTGGMFCTILYP
jgi:hypothetical protein